MVQASLKSVLENAAVAVSYLITALLGFTMAIPPGNITTVWPPSGIALAAVLLLGFRVWPGIWFGSFIANSLFFSETVHPFHMAPLFCSIAIAVGSTLQALVGAALIEKWIGAGRSVLDRAKHVFKFTVIEMGSCFVAATFGVTSLLASGFLPSHKYFYSWFTWWVGDFVGAILVAPFLVVWCRHLSWRWEPKRWLEGGAMLAVVILGSYILFGSHSPVAQANYPITFLLFPMLLWSSFRFGQSGVTLSCLILGCIAVWGTIQGNGPFVRGSVYESLLLMQAFLAVITLCSFVLAGVLTERRHGHRQLAQANYLLLRRASQLEEANRELESFSYSVSHDLRAPLTLIAGYAKVFKEREGAGLNPEAARYLELIRQNTERLEHLIDDFLAFSHLGRQPIKMREIEMTKLANDIVGEIKIHNPGRHFEWVVNPMPPAFGDWAMIRQVFTNYLENAVKFTRHRSSARIEVGHRDGGEFDIYFVKDNGVGFDVRRADQLFQVFQRLHSPDIFEGIGAGLAIVQRIIERHGGRVWAEGIEGEGAIFYFSLPRRAAARLAA